MGESIPPESKSDPTAPERDPHRPVTLPPPEPDFDDEHAPSGGPFRAAVEAGARTGSGLTELSGTVAELLRGLSAASQANERLLDELSALRALLESARERELSYIDRTALLERERELVTAQQDEFLTALLEEHEDTRTRAAKTERERDELRAEASQLRARLGTHRTSTNPPPQLSATRPPAFRSSPPLQLDPGELDATLPARSWTGQFGAATPVFASPFPHESTRPGVGGPEPSQPPPPPSFEPRPSSLPPPPVAITTEPPPRPVSAASLPSDSVGSMPILKRKPDPTTRPLVDYSLGEGGVESEMLEGVRIPTKSSKPPRK